MKVPAGRFEEIPEKHCVPIGDGRAVVVRVNGEVVAFPNRCLHQDSPLAGGIVLDEVLICPLHFWRYRLPEGEHISGARLRSFAVIHEDGDVFVDLPDPQPKQSMREMLLAHAREWSQKPVIKGVIWDMGGVFRRYFTEVMVEIGRNEDWPLDRLPLGPTGDIPDPDYDLMTTGGLTEPEYLARLLERLRSAGIDYNPKGHDWSKEDRPETWKAIRLIAESPLRQAILTNDASLWMGERWWESWPPAQYFDAIVDVATLEERKPDPEPYRVAIRQIELPPGQCVFVDDMDVNCRGAETVGMSSLFFDITQPEKAIAQLLDMIGLQT